MDGKREFVKPERQLDDFTKDFNAYLKDLSKGYQSTKNVSVSFKLLAKNSWKVLYRLMQKFSPVRPNLFPVIAAIWAIPALGLPAISITTYPKYGIPGVLVVIAVSGIILRHLTLKSMATPGDDLFHHEIFGKKNPRLKTLLQKYYEDAYFDLETIKKEVAAPSLNDKVVSGYLSQIENLNNQVQDLKNQISEARSEGKEFETQYEATLNLLVDTEKERENLAKVNEYITSFMEGMQRNVMLLIHSDFGKQFLRALNFEEKFSLYRLTDDGFLHECSCGVNEGELNKLITDKHNNHEVMLAYNTGTEVIEKEDKRYTKISKCINLSVDQCWVVVLYFDKKELSELKEDEEFAMIKLNTTFDLFWVCLEIVAKYEILKNQLEEAK